MKRQKTIKLFGIIALAAVIGFGMAGCGGDEDDPNEVNGKLTIIGIPAVYNGYWVVAQGEFSEIPLAAAGEAQSGLSGKGGKINGGSVTLNVWILNESTFALSEFNGSGGADFGVFIIRQETFDLVANGGDLEGIIIGDGKVSAIFAGGKGSGVFKLSEED